MDGKTLRLKRFLTRPNGRIVIFPLDHGVSCGPIRGLERMEDVVRMGIEGGADGLVLHKGMLDFLESISGRLPGVFMHLSASTQLGPSFHHKVLVGTVEEALRRGADGVSLHVNLGDQGEPEMLKDLGTVGSMCADWHIPLLVMTYARGVHVPQPVPDAAIAHAARVAAELGADIIKIPTPKDDWTLAKITADLRLPVVVAGGSKDPDTRLFLDRVGRSLAAGASGVAVGRNVFQSERPLALLRAICSMVHRDVSASEAWDRLSDAPDDEQPPRA
jgi:predicted phospho-2-dehydro-3-deoxyheptonate aldolase